MRDNLNKVKKLVTCKTSIEPCYVKNPMDGFVESILHALVVLIIVSWRMASLARRRGPREVDRANGVLGLECTIIRAMCIG